MHYDYLWPHCWIVFRRERCRCCVLFRGLLGLNKITFSLQIFINDWMTPQPSRAFWQPQPLAPRWKEDCPWRWWPTLIIYVFWWSVCLSVYNVTSSLSWAECLSVYTLCFILTFLSKTRFDICSAIYIWYEVSVCLSVTCYPQIRDWGVLWAEH